MELSVIHIYNSGSSHGRTYILYNVMYCINILISQYMISQPIRNSNCIHLRYIIP